MICRFKLVTFLSHPDNEPTTNGQATGGGAAVVEFLKNRVEKCLFYIFLTVAVNFSDLTFFCHKPYFKFDLDMITNSVSNQNYDVTKRNVEQKKGLLCYILLHNVTNRSTVDKVDCHTLLHFNGVLRCNEPERVRNKKQVCDKCDRFFVVITAKTTYND